MNRSTLTAVRRQLQELADSEIAAHSARFFKTGPGEYGEGDRFLGIRVPVLRKLARQHRELTLRQVESLLHSKFHEERLLALLVLVQHYDRGDDASRAKVFELYRQNLAYVNNWDLIDGSAHQIVGRHLRTGSRRYLYKLAASKRWYERRIAIMATYDFIKNDDFDETLQLAEQLLHDEEDLIQKAVGWMLREVGKRDLPLEEKFLKAHHAEMPRTMLRYAIEKLPQERRRAYLEGRV